MNSELVSPMVATGESHFCTLFDSVYLTRGIALYHSLRRGAVPANLVALCLDSKAHQVLECLALPGLSAVTVDQLEKREPRLREARLSRKPVEFYFTCKPVLTEIAAEMFPRARRITYLDSDLYYFEDPNAFEARHGRNSIALTSHRFSPGLEGRDCYGKFNAGWVSASCDPEGRRFVEWWRERCLEWCKLDVEEDRFADQKYLDRVPGLFSNVERIDSAGANLAPWNMRHVRIEATGDSLSVNGEPVSFFHFHGLRRMMAGVYDSGLGEYGVSLQDEVQRLIFRPYLEELGKARQLVARSTGTRLDRRPEYAPDNWMRRYKHMAALLFSNTWVSAWS